jgi:hypothetical protein
MRTELLDGPDGWRLLFTMCGDRVTPDSDPFYIPFLQEDRFDSDGDRIPTDDDVEDDAGLDDEKEDSV